MTSPPSDPAGLPLWRALLHKRRTVRFGNFAWFSIDTLLLAANDQLIKVIEDHRSGASVVDRRRMRWVAQQRDRGVRAEEPVPLPDSRGLLMLGDPGEMDASQYVLVKDLAEERLSLLKRRVDNVLLMSDVVYPAGDINEWADAVYLPYFGLPKGAWRAATTEHAHSTSDPAERERLEKLRPPFLGMRVFALPGNHDWYDGLNGFMYHACGAEPLSEVAYDDSDLNWRGRAVRRWWRNPAEPRRELLWDLREDAQNEGHPSPANEGFVARAAVNPDHHGLPNVRGPYFALDLGKAEGGGPLLRIVVVDTGVKASIDLEQARIVRRWLNDDGVPKVVVTGVPLLVNNKVQPVPIAQAERQEEELRRHYLLPDKTKVEPISHDLLQLMRAGKGVIATIAGDTHNYQRIQPHLAGDVLEVGEKWPTGLPPVQIVAGGAGAYLSATHVINRLQGLRRVEPLAADADGDSDEWPVAERTEFPSREASVLHYFKNLRGPVYFGILAAMLVVAAGLVWWASTTETAPHARWEVAIHFLVAVAPLVWAAALYAVARRSAWVRGAAYVAAAVVLGVAGVLLARVDEWGALSVYSITVGVGVVVVTVFAVVAPPLARGFPGVRRSWPVRLAGVALLVALQQGTGAPALEFVVLAVAAYAALRGVSRLLDSSGQALQRRQIAKPNAALAPLLFVVGLVPTLVTVGGAFVLLVVRPSQTLDALGLSEHLAGLVRVDSLVVDITCLLLLPAVGLGLPVTRLRRVVPAVLVVGAPIVGVAVGVLAVLLGTAVVTALALALVAALLAATVYLFVAALLPTDASAVAQALVVRDGASGARCNTATAARMVVSNIPSIDSMAEATEPPFHKNVLLLEVGQETAADGKPVTVVTLTARFLDDESRPGAAGTGLYTGDQVTLRYRAE